MTIFNQICSLFLGCKKAFYILDQLDQHVQSEEHQNDTVFKCTDCGLQVPKEAYCKHLFCHSGYYQCIFCPLGATKLDKVRNHMCDQHPERLLYVSTRALRNDKKIVRTSNSKSPNYCKLLIVIYFYFS